MKYYVTMFGEFTISSGGVTLKDSSKRSPKMWLLFAYLIYNRNKKVTLDELIKLLWGEGAEGSVGALKTLVYRLRLQLSIFENGQEIIISDKYSYAVNPKLIILTDVDRFRHIYTEILKSDDVSDSLLLFREFSEVYKGQFLPKFTQYKDIYTIAETFLKQCEEIVNLLMNYNDSEFYGDIISVSQKLLRAAPESKILKDILIIGIANWKKLYEEPQKHQRDDLHSAISALSEKEIKSGAKYYEHEYFQDLYRLETLLARRHKRNAKFFLFTLLETEITKKDYSIYMETLGRSINENLRMSDVYTKYNNRQYAVMLYRLDMNFCEEIIKRIKNKFETLTALTDCLFIANFNIEI